MKEMTCIVCPNGCRLRVGEKDGEITVEGNRCKRGIEFAVSEMTNPVRTISSTVATVFPEFPVLPVKVSKAIPKSKIFDVMKEINKVTVVAPVGAGDVVIADVLGLDADIVASSNVLAEAYSSGRLNYGRAAGNPAGADQVTADRT